MREIKFRGWTQWTPNKWVYGLLSIQHDKSYTAGSVYISTDEYIPESMDGRNRLEVIPESIGQYTGQKDKNGVEIYEGDILIELDTNEKYKIYFDTSLSMYRAENITDYCDDRPFNGLDLFDCDVIGNIYENPELPDVKE